MQCRRDDATGPKAHKAHVPCGGRRGRDAKGSPTQGMHAGSGVTVAASIRIVSMPDLRRDRTGDPVNDCNGTVASDRTHQHWTRTMLIL